MKKWLGSKPDKCQLCGRDFKKEKHFIDGRTKQGPWGLICTKCHKTEGCGLGVGCGQMYEVKTLMKVGG